MVKAGQGAGCGRGRPPHGAERSQFGKLPRGLRLEVLFLVRWWLESLQLLESTEVGAFESLDTAMETGERLKVTVVGLAEIGALGEG